jgi:hypothetical protein
MLRVGWQRMQTLPQVWCISNALGEVGGCTVSQAQELSEKEAAARLANVRRNQEQVVPVMFFGTLEVAWMAKKDVVSWSEGIAANLHCKGKQRKIFIAAVEEVGSGPTFLGKVGGLLTAFFEACLLHGGWIRWW